MADLYARVIDSIIAALEGGVRPWTKPRTEGSRNRLISRPLRANGVPYRGINTIPFGSGEKPWLRASPPRSG
jgi:antirestriction protein ArdC